MNLKPIEINQDSDPAGLDWENEAVQKVLARVLQEEAAASTPRANISALSTPDAVQVSFAGQCDRGIVREENQDCVLHTDTPLGDLLIVADGIGGFAGGSVASRMTVESISASLAAMPSFFPPVIAIQEAALRANADIAIAAAEPGTPNNRMGSTVVLALLRTDPDRAHAPVQATIGHIGDSRAYLVHNGQLTHLTCDHSKVQSLVDRGTLAPEKACLHPETSVLTRCLGREPQVAIDLKEVALEVGDTLLLCSDGLWRFVPESEIASVAADPSLDAEAASRALLDLALATGGKDNVGIQLARVGVPALQRATQRPIAMQQSAEPVLSVAAPAIAIPTSASSIVIEPDADMSYELAPAIAPGPVLVFPSLKRENLSKTELYTHMSDPVLALRAAAAVSMPQHKIIKHIAIFMLGFVGSTTLAYFALVNNWFNVMHLLH